MNKNLDHLFEQARKSMQSEMPLEEVQQLIHGQAPLSLWTNQKIWIMSTSIIGILTISFLCWLNSEQPKPSVATNIVQKETVVTKDNSSVNKTTIALKDAMPDNIPLPILDEKKLTPKYPTLVSSNETTRKNISNNKLTSLDSLGPKKTFTEYKLEIKKENSEQEIKKLKSELANYGIHMNIKELSYNNENKIKRFKGQFKTDSLFCGSTMNDYEFDISGAFKSMEFIFRVADNKNLKYLKIQSENFEETIECYDDEVISNTEEARKLSRQMHEEMARAQEEMAKAHDEMVNAQLEMATAQLEIAKAQEEVARLRQDKHLNQVDREAKRFDRDEIVNWEKIEADIQQAMENVEIDLEGINEDILDALDDMEVIILDKDFKDDMKVLQKDLAKIRIDIDREIREQLKEHRIKKTNKRTYEFSDTPASDYRFPDDRQKIIIEGKTENLRVKLERRERTAKELKEEAKSMEEAAKKLKKEAKERRKMAKKKAKNK